MTRNEAKREAHSQIGLVGSDFDYVIYLIDKIYDDFESKGCDSCKFSWEDDKYKYLKCGYINEDNMKDCSGHYCGQWESK